jgi:transketolase
MRESFSKNLVELVKKDPKVYLLSGDHGYALFDSLRKEKPDHFINAGVAEQNMIGVGAGMSKLGLYPIMYGLSAFVPVRVLEQIKIDFCYENLPGLFIGDGAGVVYSHLGASHQSTEDIASLRGIPNISILSPCDSFELEICFKWAVQQEGPVYLRMGKSDLGNVHKGSITNLSLSPVPVIVNSERTALFATGSMVKPCMDLVLQKRVKADLYSLPVLKLKSKLDFAAIVQKYDRIITLEEHSVDGGLGDLVAGIAAATGKTLVSKIGIESRFSEHCGTYQYLMKEHGLDEASLQKKINFFSEL